MLARGDVHDPVIQKHMITVPEVQMSPDLRVATIYVMPLGGRDVKDVLDAYSNHDDARALEVWRRDGEIDAIYTSLFRELLTYMMEDPRHITFCTHLLFAAKNIERIGDHATNIAETVHYLVIGEPLSDERPKSDTSSLTKMSVSR